MIPTTALEIKEERNKRKSSPFCHFQILLETQIIFSCKLFYKSSVKKLMENFQRANDFTPSFISSIVNNGEIILVLDLSFPLLLTAIYSWGKTHPSLSRTKSAIILLGYKARFGPLYSMSFCFLIETYNKGSFMINIHRCTDMPTNADMPSRDCKKPIVCKHKIEKLKNLIGLSFF